MDLEPRSICLCLAVSQVCGVHEEGGPTKRPIRLILLKSRKRTTSRARSLVVSALATVFQRTIDSAASPTRASNSAL
ncbi:hypothetical protein MGG_15541 [Pyricularia oryzae 70-15]|uniref:Uncharacterized protein n=3 Tax=Pyricularia oryzae TaxID=318829 RepID=G4MSC7_PYRO7|nr:uncharacterized protein MGG_15541 [Pyricularia oryzae 70-15]EHA53739.1 hypothetical protein MGG_15541 [Pyricularia oryzae 70-15]ELQ34890.1 hypothetical protein OOU_Y34scaffold00744g54 [Pyricularia oryzae Y34]